MAGASLRILVIAVTTLGCSGRGDPGGASVDGASPDAGRDGSTDAAIPDYPYRDLDVGCAPIFAQWIVPEYHLTIAPDHWAALQDEFLHPLGPDGTFGDPRYHPAQLHIVEGPREVDPPNVMVRLHGNTSWLQAILFDENPKMQFTIAFNKVDPDGRFERLRKVTLDMPRNDQTFLQQRVAVAWLRGRAGVPAPCANNARVYINGAYYGLYTNLEHQDKSFLQRVYGADDEGDLWKGGRVISTNEDSPDWDRINALWAVTDLTRLDALTDLDASMREWASEAVIGDADGYNQGRPNFYLYDHPASRRFVWLANDLDTALDWDYLPPDTTPVFDPMPRFEPDWYHYLIALNDPAGRARYVTALRDQLPKLDPDELATWIDDWSAQIADAADDDPHRPFSASAHDAAVARMKTYAPARARYLQRWLDCWDTGGLDGDGDGHDLCHDCNDADANQSPGAAEVCDAADNDCDGRVDDLESATCDPGPASQQAATWTKVLTDPKRRR